MQEEVEQKIVTLIINCSKLTEQELKKAMTKILAVGKNRLRNPHGKMSVKKLAAQNRGMQSIEVNDQNIGSFTRIARKYGIDFAPFRVKGQDRYLVFFKSQDADAMTAAFEAYTAKTMNREKRQTVREILEHYKALIQSAVRPKTKNKELER